VEQAIANPAAAGPRIWLYKLPFAIDGQGGLVRFDARLSGLYSTLLIDGDVVATDMTPASGAAATRNHRLSTTLPDGSSLEIEAGYVDYIRVGIAVRRDGQLIHESHPGRTIAYPERMARMLREQNAEGKPSYDVDKLKQNKVPILVDIAASLLFFVVAKFTDLRTAALVGAGVGIALMIAQRFVKVDLIGGMALFGIIMLLVSAGFAIAFEDEELIKQRSTIVGLVGATFFLLDGLLLRGKRLGRGMSRYLAYTDIDERRLALGMGASGVILAVSNYVVVKLVSTDVWLFYTTFGDVPLSLALVLLAIRWSRQGRKSPSPSSR
jgi:intracellular septation protein A